MTMLMRFFLFACLVWFACSTSIVNASDLSKRINAYFPGQWTIELADGSSAGEVHWKKVAGGLGLAGPGTTSTGETSFSMAGWDPKEKTWVHTWISSDGSYGRLNIMKFEGDTYHGRTYVVDKDGQVQTDGAWHCKIVDQDHFEITPPADGTTKPTRWTRMGK